MIDAGLFLFLASVAVISLSGVIVPGPLLAVTIAKGPEGPHAGLWTGLGHGIVEMPLIALIALGFGTFFSSRPFTLVVGVLGGAMLVYLGAGIVQGARRTHRRGGEPPLSRRPLRSACDADEPVFLRLVGDDRRGARREGGRLGNAGARCSSASCTGRATSAGTGW